MLSDACFEFKRSVADGSLLQSDAARRLKKMIDWYKRPAFNYGKELRDLEKVCDAYLNDKTALNFYELLKTAENVQTILDCPYCPVD